MVIANTACNRGMVEIAAVARTRRSNSGDRRRVTELQDHPGCQPNKEDTEDTDSEPANREYPVWIASMAKGAVQLAAR